MMRCLKVGIVLLGSGCANTPDVPVVPLDRERTAEVYDVALTDLKRLMVPKNPAARVNWSERMYLNPVVLLPQSDSSTPLAHDPVWLASVAARGMVIGVCGRWPAEPCPTDVPVAFTSLSAPWSHGTDTAWVQGGYTGEYPGEPTYEGVFWIFTIAHDEEGVLKVVRRGPPNYVSFESQ
jgi:hypothetical protein